MKLNLFILIGLIITLIYTFSCQVNPDPESSPFNPTIELSPSKKVANTSATTLTIRGNGFDSGSTIYFDGKQMTTIFESSSVLKCTIEEADLAIMNGSGSVLKNNNEESLTDKVVDVYVKTSKGEESVHKNFTIHLNYVFKDPITLIEVTDGITRVYRHELMFDSQGRIFLGYMTSTPLDNGQTNYKIQMMYSDDSGEVWTMPIDLFDYTDLDNKLEVLYTINNNDQLYVFFSIGINWDNKNLYLIQSDDRGESWSSPRLINNSFRHIRSIICGNNGKMFLLGEKIDKVFDRNGSVSYYYQGLAFSNSKNYGQTWSKTKLIDGRFNNIYREYIRTYDISAIINPQTGRIHISYMMDHSRDYYQNFTQYTDDVGETWSNPYGLKIYKLGNNVSWSIADTSMLALDQSGYLYVLWNNFESKDFDFAKSIDSGLTWNNMTKEIPFDRKFNGRNPTILVGKRGILNAYSGMFFLRSSSGGNNWTNLIDIDNLVFFDYMKIDSNGIIYGLEFEHNSLYLYKSY